MKVKDILQLMEYETIVSICYYDTYDNLCEVAVITPNTPISEYKYIRQTYGNKEVAKLRVDMEETLTIIYRA